MSSPPEQTRPDVAAGRFRGSRQMSLITAAGTYAVPYLPDGERSLIIAADGDPSVRPRWYHDIVAEPRVTTEVGGARSVAHAEVLDAEESARLFARAVEADPAWQRVAAGGTVPVVALHDVAEGPPEGPIGDLLVTVHDVFRRELATIREEIDGSRPAGRLVAQLRANCLTFCHWLHGHHTGESERVFPLLARRHPELAPVLERLEQEHQTVGQLLDRMQELLRSDVTVDDLRVGFDRLASQLEAHLAYEEEQIVAALNSLDGLG